MTQNLPTHPRVHLLTLRQVLAQKPLNYPVVKMDATVQEALHAMVEQVASAVLVIDATQFVGLVSERDVLHHAARVGHFQVDATPLHTVMTTLKV